MNDILKELFKMSSCLDTKGIKVIGTETSTAFSIVDESKDLVLYVQSKQVIPEFQGIFGISQLKMLESLLGYEGYKSQAPMIDRFTRRVELSNGTTEEIEVPKQMNFKDKRGGKGVFYFSHGKSILGSDVPSISFEIEFEPEAEVVKEFIKLGSIYATAESSLFSASLANHELRLKFGIEGATTNHGEMIFAENVRGVLASNLHFDSKRFSSVLKTVGSRSCKIGMSNRKLIRTVFSTELATYQFWLRGAVTGAV